MGRSDCGMKGWARTAVVRLFLCLLGAMPAKRAAFAAEPPVPDVKIAGPARPIFVPTRDGCDGSDVPDIPARAFRDADGQITMFALHYTNHPLRGDSFDTLKIVCHSAFPSHENADPAAYDDRSWLAATWTRDGRDVSGLVHHEFQANAHPGRCRFPDYMRCWFNTVLAVRSTDGGKEFTKNASPVVASAPFRQDEEQGRHRGFFNPSNIVSDGSFFYFLASTTGWAGQEGGVCLFRTANPDDPSNWRAFDGTAFSVRYSDPYRRAMANLIASCAPVAPFPAPVGGLVHQRGTGVWFAVFQASKNDSAFPVSGFYAAASRDLLHWSEPRLVLAATTNYDDPCKSGGRLVAYPTLLDPGSGSRNFDEAGSTADLFYTSMRVDGCSITDDRTMIRQSVTLGLKR